MPARRPVSGPGRSFIGRGTAFSAKSKRLRWTIIVIRGEGQSEPWIILTDLEPMDDEASWREMRFWMETGFNALKSAGWQWQKIRRTDPERVERSRLVSPPPLAFGNRVEDAQALSAPPKAAPERRRLASELRLGWLGGAEPPSDQGRDMAPRPAAARPFPIPTPSFPFAHLVIPALTPPVIPAKSGIQTVAANLAIRNQA